MVAGSARSSRACEAEGIQHALTVGAEQESHEERRQALIPRVAERGDRIPGDDLLPFGDVDPGDAPRGGHDVGDVHDARVGLASATLFSTARTSSSWLAGTSVTPALSSASSA